MTLFECKMCGKSLEHDSGASVAKCGRCGTAQTLPSWIDEDRADLYNRANRYRRFKNFDDALEVYEEILEAAPTDAEAHWSIVLCRYGIGYEENGSSKKMRHVIHRVQFTQVAEDEHYKQALQYADSAQRKLYEEEARLIDEELKGIYEYAQELSVDGDDVADFARGKTQYDVFVSYLGKDPSTDFETLDALDVRERVCFPLSKKGYRVFCAPWTFEDNGMTTKVNCDAFVLAGMFTAKVMLVLGSRPGYFKAEGTKIDWSRYLQRIDVYGEDKTIIPLYRNMSAEDLPDELRRFESFDISESDAMDAVVKKVEQLLAAQSAPTPAVQTKAPAGGGASGYGVRLLSDGGSKLLCIKVIREAFGMGLREAKDLVEDPSGMLATNVSMEEAERLKEVFTSNHMDVEIVGAGGNAAAPIDTDAADSSDSYTVRLVSSGSSKLLCVKVVKETFGLSLKDAKDLVEDPSRPLTTNVTREEAERLRDIFTENGFEVTVQDSTGAVVSKESGAVQAAAGAQETDEVPSAVPEDDDGTRYNVRLISSGSSKLLCVKVVRETFGLGLKEAKDLVEDPSRPMATNVTRAEAERLTAIFTENGFEVAVEDSSGVAVALSATAADTTTDATEAPAEAETETPAEDSSFNAFFSDTPVESDSEPTDDGDADSSLGAFFSGVLNDTADTTEGGEDANSSVNAFFPGVETEPSDDGEGTDSSIGGFFSDTVAPLSTDSADSGTSGISFSPKSEPAPAPKVESADALLGRMQNALTEKDWDGADSYCDRMLAIEPENAQAYIGKLFVYLKCSGEEELENVTEPLDTLEQYADAMRYADESTAERLTEYDRLVKEAIDRRENEVRAEQKRKKVEAIRQRVLAERQKAEEERRKAEEAIREEEEARLREEEERKKAAEEKRQRALWRAGHLCQYCGGTLKGLFSKKCSVCGKPKDY